MKKFVLLLLALVGLPASLMLLSMPGCSNPCADLRDLCNSDCADTNYEDACRSVADGSNESLCSGQLAGFRSNCSVIPNVGGAPTTPESCNNGQVLCSGPSGALCVSLNSNPKYCGACNNDCTANAAGGAGGTSSLPAVKCAAGSCVSECPDTLSTDCSDSCVDTETDPNNCGGCADECPDGHVCVCEIGKACSDGACVSTSCKKTTCSVKGCDPVCEKKDGSKDGCDTPTTSCSTDGCDPACQKEGGSKDGCGEPETVDACCEDKEGETPELDEAKTLCDGSCAALATDPLNCGACGNVCSAGQLCSNGGCASICAEGLTECSGKCVDVNTDPLNCGACAGAGSDGSGGAGGGATAITGTCPASASKCSHAECVVECAAGQKECPDSSGACVDPDNSVQHCGDCFNLCAEGEKCASGNCVSGCGETETECGSTCAKLDSDPNNCGVCGNGCSGSTPSCSLGVCKTACDSGLIDCEGSCVDTDSDPNYCGGCDKGPCTTSLPKCSEGACAATCGPGLTDCNNHCINLTEDNFSHCGSCNNSCGDESVCTADSCVVDTENSSFKCQNFSVAANCTDDNPCTDDKCDAKLGCVQPFYTVAEWAGICAGPNGDASACYVCEWGEDLNVQTGACKSVAAATCKEDINDSSCLAPNDAALCKDPTTTVSVQKNASDTCCKPGGT